jgi:crotonobetainyl-CoA:carnitine CoA-transferase CaiB-like acyl-CoA transferase
VKGSELPLSGVRVVDLTHFVAGPWGTMILAELGADVIKVEPRGGEIGRRAGRVYAGDQSAIFLGFNRSKRSIAVDLKNRDGVGVVHRLVGTADAVIDNFRPGTAARLGIDHGTLSNVNPTVVSVSLSAFGPSGPYRNRPANDPIIQALTGVMHASGDPDGEPLRLGVSVPDFAGAVVGALAIVAGLHARDRTGRGLQVTSSLLDAQLFSQLDVMMEHLIPSRRILTSGELGRSVSHRAFQASDGRGVLIAPDDGASVAALLTLIGFESFDPPTPDPLLSCLESYVSARSAALVVSECERAGVPASEVFDLPAVLGPGGIGGHLVDEYVHVTSGHVRYVKAPTGLPESRGAPPPILGADTDALLLELGYDEAERQSLFEDGVVGTV